MPPSSAIHQSLSILLPAHAQKLPAALVQLAESLLARSRQRATRLKPEEEIARAFACSEIACTRLRVKCRLPAPKAGVAPCKPAVYKRLVGFLEQALKDEEVSAAPETPGSAAGKKRRADGSIKKSRDSNLAARTGEEHEENEDLQNTPSKPTRGHRHVFTGKVKATSRRRSTDKEQDNRGDGSAPGFTMPSIRRLCKTFSTPLLAPHVYTGVCVVLKLDELWPPPTDDDVATADEESATKEKTTGLIIALYLMTLTRMQRASKMTTAVYKSTCARAVDVLGYNTKGVRGVEEWIRRINRQGYAVGQDWWASVPEKVFDFDPNASDAVEDDDSDDHDAAGAEFNQDLDVAVDDAAEDEDDDDVILSRRSRRRRVETTDPAEEGKEEEEEDPEDVLLPGLHTMMQPSVDYLADERTRAFEAWKTKFLRQLDRADEKHPDSSPAAAPASVKAARGGRAKAKAIAVATAA